MVEWRPATGWLPPLSEEAWRSTFEAYQAYPEYQKVNAGMTLQAFKGIFWLEYVHRLWGRVIGLAFALPFAVFLARGWIDRRLAWTFAGMFVLGGLQGLVGWLMVKSGLIDRPDVSQYRLVAHLGLALAIYAYILWVAIGLLSYHRAAPGPTRTVPAQSMPRVRWPALALCGLILMTALFGGFVAGLDAGYAYNTFPLMDGDLIPPGLFAASPVWRSLFEDVTTVQFVHRLLATLTLLAILSFRLWLRRLNPLPRARLAANLLTAWVVVQYGLGIATLLSFVAIPVAALHQASAVVLWSLALWTAFELRKSAIREGQPSQADERPAPSEHATV